VEWKASRVRSVKRVTVEVLDPPEHPELKDLRVPREARDPEVRPVPSAHLVRRARSDPPVLQATPEDLD
jgi:hypothetical protein